MVLVFLVLRTAAGLLYIAAVRVQNVIRVMYLGQIVFRGALLMPDMIIHVHDASTIVYYLINMMRSQQWQTP